ncbi:MAG: NAD(P)/FAD-dependent oxidoreductase [Pseudomonadota bacterium]
MNEKTAIIIGAGPVGLFAAFTLGMKNIKSVVIDTLDFIGGQCQALYPDKPIYDIPGHVKITGSELTKVLAAQNSRFAPEYLLGQQVVALKRLEHEKTWQLTTSTGAEYISPTIVIAGGCGAFGPNRPPLAQLDHYENSKSVRYMVGDMQEFKDKSVVIAGGGDSAVDWAINLAAVAKKVYLVHRRPKFRAHPNSINQLHQLAKTNKLELVIPYQLSALTGSGGKLNGVEVKDLDGNLKLLEAEYLLPFFGLAMDLGPIANWELNLSKNTIAVDQTSMATNLPGIFAIGDIAHYQNKHKLILTGFAEAATAASECYKILYPDTPLHFEYSTTKFAGA